jgi:hypothetical protein
VKGGGGRNIDVHLKKRGFHIVSCEEVGEERFICQLESGRQVQAFLQQGRVLVVKPV